YIDLITGVARPDQKDFINHVSSRTAVGAAEGFAIGTATFPVIGTLVGVPAGAVIGAFKGTLEWITDRRDAIEKNRDLDARQKRAQLQLIDRLEGQVKATSKKLETLAEILAGPKKYGWGSQ